MLAKRIAILVLALVIAVLSAGYQGQAAPPSDASIAKRHHLTLDEVKALKGFRGLTPQMLYGLPNARVRKLLYRATQPRPTDALASFKHIALIRAGGSGVTAPADALEKLVADAGLLHARVSAPATRPASATVARGTASNAPTEIVSMAGLPVSDSGVPPRARADAKAKGKTKGGLATSPRNGMLSLDYAPLLPEAQTRLRAQSDLSPRNWRWLGPTNVGGRTRAIIIHPTQHNIMWAAGTGGGVWKSVDAGASWAPLADFMASINVVSLVLDPRNPNTIFAGTGEGTPNADAFRGLGVFRSLDGGATWARLTATGTAAFHYVNRIAFTSDGNAMLLAARGGLFRSVDFRETDPGNVRFVQEADSPGTDRYGYMQVGCNPRDPAHCIASGYHARVEVSRDAGVTWTLATGLPTMPVDRSSRGRVEFAFAVANPSIVYASIDVNDGEIWRSTNGGTSFARVNTGNQYLGGQGWYDNAIWAGDPRRADLVIVGGVDLHRSTNGGQTLSAISDWRYAPRSAHGDHHAITSHPRYNGVDNHTVYFGNDGGVYRHDNVLTAAATNGWVVLNNNYGITQFFSVAGNVKSGRLIGGAQDNGTLVYVPPSGTGGAPQAFRTTFGADGAYSAADPEDPNILYGSTQFMGLHRSVDGGGRSERISRGITDAGEPRPGQPRTTLFIAPFILDPSNRRTMLAGGASLWRSRNVIDAVPAWQPVKPPIVVSGGDPDDRLISAVEARATVPNSQGADLIWVGHVSGDIYRTLDGLSDQPTWEHVSRGHAELPRRIITRIRAYREAVFTALNEGTGTLFVTYGGYSRRNIWRSTDDGRTWTDIHGTLPAVAVADVAAHPRNRDWLYAATEIGVFASADGGTTWAPTNRGPANVSVAELLWMGERLVAATHGRGLFWIDLSGPVGISSTPSPAPPPAVAPPAPSASPPAPATTPPVPATPAPAPKPDDPTDILRR